MAYQLEPEVQILRDDNNNLRELDHSDKPYSSNVFLKKPKAKEVAEQYLKDLAAEFDFADNSLISISKANPGLHTTDGTRLHYVRDKEIGNLTVVEYEQAYHGLPIWQSSVAVRINTDMDTVTGATNNVRYNIELPNQNFDAPFRAQLLNADTLPRLLGIKGTSPVTITATREIIYQYFEQDRVEQVFETDGFQSDTPSLDLPDFVELQISDGDFHIVTEVLFTYELPGWGELNWRALIEPNQGAVLYLRALVACVNGSIFQIDPVTQGCPTCTGSTTASILNNFRTSLPLLGLTAPQAGDPQALEGEYIKVENIDPPNIQPPTQSVGNDFVYSAITDDFTAVNAYYHCDFVFRYIQNFGINVATYFAGTTFPVPTDARGKNSAVNASCNGNASGNGVGKLLFGLVQGGEPVGIATALRVVLHEFGHALLWNHVNSPNFGFAHSAGDSMAAIYADPTSDSVDKGLTFPFLTNSNPGLIRRHDRKISDGWAWFGAQYNTQYSGEQVLSTTLFRAYQSTGGASDDLPYKMFSSQYMFYLIVKSCGLLTSMTTDPVVYVNALKQADMNTSDFQGQVGGTNYKVIRWSFEQQGLFQAQGTPKPYTTVGQPPSVDVYIDDGRQGEYQYLADWKDTQAIWNRNSSDGQNGNQSPIPGQVNYLYVKVNNRGTDSAGGVSVRGFQVIVGGQGDWPHDWTQLDTTTVSSATDIPSGGAAVLGPFEWTPLSAGASVLMIATATGDASIVDNAAISGKVIPNWRLVPFDNNNAQRTFVSSQQTSGIEC